MPVPRLLPLVRSAHPSAVLSVPMARGLGEVRALRRVTMPYLAPRVAAAH
jgi:hypothetical protein